MVRWGQIREHPKGSEGRRSGPSLCVNEHVSDLQSITTRGRAGRWDLEDELGQGPAQGHRPGFSLIPTAPAFEGVRAGEKPDSINGVQSHHSREGCPPGQGQET